MKEGPKILLLDEDELQMEMLETLIYLSKPSYHVYKARTLETALLWVEKFRFDLVITEAELSGSAKFAEMAHFVNDLGRHEPAPHIIVLTSMDILKSGGRLHVDAWISKPPDSDALLTKIDDLLANSRQSIVRGLSVESFLQVLSHDGMSCALTVRSGAHSGRIYLEEGQIIHADVEDAESKKALLMILSWPDCEIRIGGQWRVARTIHQSLTSLLMEAAYCRDLGDIANGASNETLLPKHNLPQ